jgi:hypothetical protein
MGGSTRKLRARGIVAVTFVFALAPAIARADYTGSVAAGTQTVTLQGSGPVQLSTAGGVLHHGSLGSFADGTDFDSSQSGDQTVPDASGWTINVTGGGSDTLEIDEGEATNPVSYNFGHTFVPGGVPCAVRAPIAQEGIQVDPDPTQAMWFCYPSGINKLVVRPGTGSIQYGVLDTQPGVPLYLYGGSGGDDELTESADVPTEVGGFHDAASPVYFTGGAGADQVTYDDDQGSTHQTYTIGNGVISKTGQYPLNYSHLGNGSIIVLYPQQGPSTIDIGPTGRVPTQIFGNFFSQPGPDVIDGSKADAELFVTGSLGNDTITTSSVAGGYYFGGGGNPTIYATDNPGTQIDCTASGPAKGTVYAVKADRISGCATVNYPATKLVLSHLSFKSARVKKGAKLTLRTPGIAAGQLSLTYKLHACTGHGHKRRCSYKTAGSRSLNVKAGSPSVSFSSQANEGHRHRLKKLAAGAYRVAIVETAGKFHSNTVTLALNVR